MPARVAFVVQRYGLEIGGGAERLCREVVERLAGEFQVEVLTTCARDYRTWENEYPAGRDAVNGIPVRRFPTTRTRDPQFRKRAAQLYDWAHTSQDELDWLHAQGPVTPLLLRYLAQHHLDYDAFVFLTYLYYPTVLGLRLVADRALLVPTAHDEPPLYLGLYDALFHSPRAIIYNTIEEKWLLQGVFGIGQIPSRVAGVGVAIPDALDSASFRQRYQVDTPYVVYVGRVGTPKNCHVLLDYFARYKEAHPGPLTLVLVGHADLAIPDRPDVIAVGFVSEEDKLSAMAGAELFVLPSDFESLSIVFLESLAAGTPVLCKGSSAVLRGHCVRSNAALYYDNYPEFEASLEALLTRPGLRRALGQRGREYVQLHYSWDRVIPRWVDVIKQVVQRPWW